MITHNTFIDLDNNAAETLRISSTSVTGEEMDEYCVPRSYFTYGGASVVTVAHKLKRLFPTHHITYRDVTNIPHRIMWDSEIDVHAICEEDSEGDEDA